jgi:hypothetical protein
MTNSLFNKLIGILTKAKTGKKDITKLVKKYIIDKNGRGTYVYVKPDESYHGKSIFDIIMNFFGFKSREDAKRKVINDYINEGKPKNISFNTWIHHLTEYFHHKEWWDNYFEKKFLKQLEKIKEKIQSKQTVKKEKSPKTQKVQTEKQDGLVKKIRIDIMLHIYKLYNKPNLQEEHHERESENQPKRGVERPGLQQLRNTEQDGTQLSSGVASRPSQSSQLTPDQKKYLYSRNNPRIGLDAPIKNSKTSIKRLRNYVHELLNSKKDNEFTEEEKEILKRYEGAGGLDEEGRTVHGVLYEFYTPSKVVSKTWEILKTIFNKITGKNFDETKLSILEPSGGTGRFFHDYKKNDDIDIYEIDPISSRIAKILVPNANVINKAFQEHFLKDGKVQKEYNGKLYDIVIGNPPYGNYSGKYKGLGEGKEHKRYEEYFIDRSLDTLKENGILAFVLPSRFLDSGNSKIKEKIAKKGQLITAYRLPNGIFNTTSIGTDIVIIRKTSKGGNLDDFNDGNFFKNNQNNVLGIEEIGLDQYGKQKKYIKLKEGETFDSVLDLINLSDIEIPKPGKKFQAEETKEKISESLIGNKNALGTIREKKPKTEKQKETKKQEKQETKPDIINKSKYDYDDIYQIYNQDIPKHIYDLVYQTNKKSNVKGVYDLEKLTKEEIASLIENNLCYSLVLNNKVTLYNMNSILRYNIYDLIESTERSILELQNTKLDPKLEGILNVDVLKKQLEYLKSLQKERKTEKDIYISPISKFAQEPLEDMEDKSLKDIFWSWIKDNSEDVIKFIKDNKLPFVEISEIYNYINQLQINRKESNNKNLTEEEKELIKLENSKIYNDRRLVSEKLFQYFFEKEFGNLYPELKEKVIEKYNKIYNGHVKIDYKKLPFHVEGMSTKFKDKEFTLSNIQREGSNFLYYHGSGILAYDVGVGKTLTGITTIKRLLDDKKVKKPLVVVPKSTYKKWLFEIRSAYPDIKINELYNLSNFKETPKIEDGTLSIATYEALERLMLKPENSQAVERDTIDLMKDKKTFSFREQFKEAERISEAVGKMEKTEGKSFYFEDLGFDYMMVDEAHNFKNIFKNAKLYNKKGFNEFGNITGSQSQRGLNLFYLARHLQLNNNVVHLLTATPFTNSPIEIYNMLSLVAADDLKRLKIHNLHDFMSQFVNITNEMVVTTRGNIDYTDVVKSFRDSKTLKDLINKYIDFRTAEEAKVKRPNYKYIIPMLKPNKAQIEIQEFLSDVGIEGLNEYAKLPIDKIPKDILNTLFSKASRKKDLTPNEVLRQIHILRYSTLSTRMVKDYFVEGDPIKKNIKPSFVEESPKIQYTAKLASKVYKERPDIGQIVYLPRGVEYFDEVVNYFNKMGIPKDAIAVIDSKTPLPKREEIMTSFNDPKGKIKIVIGTDTIKEGVDLNGNTALLYDLFLDWNPSSKKQLIGRMVRQGNRQKNTFVITPVIANTVDSALYQKHEEKISRWGDVWSDKNPEKVFDISGIDPNELKFDIIKNPLVLASALYREDLNNINHEIKFLKQQRDVMEKNFDTHRFSISSYSIARLYDDVINGKENHYIFSDPEFWEAIVDSKKMSLYLQIKFNQDPRKFLDYDNIEKLVKIAEIKNVFDIVKRIKNPEKYSFHYISKYIGNDNFFNLMVDQKAKKYMEKNNISYEDAYKQAYKESFNDPQLFEKFVNESKRKLNFFDLAQKLSETVFSYEGYIRYLKETLKKKERLVEKISSRYGVDHNDYMNLLPNYVKRYFEKYNYISDKIKEYEETLNKKEDKPENKIPIYEKYINKAKAIIEASKRPEEEIDEAVEKHFQEIINNLQTWDESDLEQPFEITKALLFYIVNKSEYKKFIIVDSNEIISYN